MNDERMNQPYSQADAYSESLGQYTAKTFAWMFAGLLVTFAVAVGIEASGLVYSLYAVPAWPYVLLFAELGVVIYMSARINKISVVTARSLFFVYAVLNGVVFSAYLIIFDLTILWNVFLVTALFFGLMALIGYFSKVNFSGIKPFMTAGLLFLCGFWILSMFLHLEAFEKIACTIGIFIFLLFTAYDTKKIKANYEFYGNNHEMAAKASIFSALQLYLDFINLFLYILRILGRRR